MTPRLPFDHDLTHCVWHPEIKSEGWGDVLTENGEKMTAGLCLECLLAQGGRTEAADFVLLSPSEPCKCGPGFCAWDRGIGYFGTCRPKDRASAPDCAGCGAPHQGVDGCWLCNGHPSDSHADWLLALHLGVTGVDAFDAQDKAAREGRALTLADAIREVHQRKAGGGK